MIAFHDMYLESEGDVKGSSKHYWKEIKKRSGEQWEVISEILLHTGTGMVRIL